MARTAREKPLKLYYIGFAGIMDHSIRPVLATSLKEAKWIYADWDGVPNPSAAVAAGRMKATRNPPGTALACKPLRRPPTPP